jgi:hypothetical protein
VNAEEILGTIAQIGVALPGFAGIVGALAGERGVGHLSQQPDECALFIS